MSLTLHTDTLRKYLQPVFFETGTFKGGGIDAAKAAGVKRIISIEVHEPYWRAQKERFAHDSSVTILLGDSGKILWNTIKDVNESILFWLDGHVHFDGKGEKNTPILDELAQIGRHHRKDHVIMIDDRYAMGGPLWDFVTEAQIVEAIRTINPFYRIVYEDNKEAKDGILVALPA